MIGIIIGVGVFIGMLTKLTKVEKRRRDEGWKNNGAFDYVISTVFAFLLGAAAWVAVEAIMALPAEAIMTDKIKCSEMIKSEEIISLKDGYLTEGNYTNVFFLGHGSVKEEEWYVYYTNTEYGYKKNKLSADDNIRPVYLKYVGKNEKPHIDEYAVVTRTVLKEKSIFLSLIQYIKYAKYNVGDEISISYSTFNGRGEGASAVRYEIFIPEGSIKEDYVIDME